MKCPCHSGKDYAECCKPFHEGENPPAPVDLMRARYSAYTLGLIDYIIKTTHPDHPDTAVTLPQRKKQIKNFSETTTFQGLEILNSDDTTVTFRAYLMQQGKDVSFTEKSAFAKKEGQWFYLKALNIS